MNDSELLVIQKYPGYAITKDGKVFSLDYRHKGITRELKLILCNGYFVVNLWRDRRLMREPVHRLVAMVFLPTNPSDRTEINHKNGIKIDNRPENLEWCTHTENMLHAWENGFIQIDESWIEKCRRIGAKTGGPNGKKSGPKRAKLSKEQADSIKNRLTNEHVTQKHIATEFGVSEQTISNIVHNKRAVYR